MVMVHAAKTTIHFEMDILSIHKEIFLIMANIWIMKEDCWECNLLVYAKQCYYVNRSYNTLHLYSA